MAITLKDYQKKAVQKMKNGSVLCGGVGSGKSITALQYYVQNEKDRKLYIITTAKKRDSKEWIAECLKFKLFDAVVDSWNNIKKYKDVYGCFFIFDEQRVVGSGTWVKMFLNITRKNHWVLLSATPGDVWMDYLPVFIANGFYKNKTEFKIRHCVYSPYTKYPKIEKYLDEETLVRHREEILVPMEFMRDTVRHDIWVKADYDKSIYHTIMKDRWDPYDNCPVQEMGKLMYLIRKVTNSDESRIQKLKEIILDKEYVIVFYNFDYELEAIKKCLGIIGIRYSEWNGHKHEEIPKCKEGWVYLVQYSAGCEGWNCITTDTIVFYSQNYSYRTMEQASGRIDRMNTPFKDLYYYHLWSCSPIDLAIHQKLKDKKNFNEKAFLRRCE